jgi:hypothetical protein
VIPSVVENNPGCNHHDKHRHPFFFAERPLRRGVRKCARRPLWVDSVEKVGASAGRQRHSDWARNPSSLSGRHSLRSVRQELGEFPEVLRSGGEVELVAGAVRASEPQPVEPQDALQMGEQHLHLLPLPA